MVLLNSYQLHGPGARALSCPDCLVVPHLAVPAVVETLVQDVVLGRGVDVPVGRTLRHVLRVVDGQMSLLKKEFLVGSTLLQTNHCYRR